MKTFRDRIRRLRRPLGCLGATLVLLAVGAAESGGQFVTRVSVSSDGTQSNGLSSCPAVSADGRFVASSSRASNLVPGDTNGAPDVFVHDRLGGTTTRVSVASDGSQAVGERGFLDCPALSEDGRYVVFSSRASNLVPSDTNGWRDIFVRDRQTGTTTRVSVASDGSQANGQSNWPAISRDGRFVTFTSSATNLVPEGAGFLLHDRQTASTTSTGLNVLDFSEISADAQVVAYRGSGPSGFTIERADLVSGDNRLLDERSISLGPALSADGGTVVWAHPGAVSFLDPGVLEIYEPVPRWGPLVDTGWSGEASSLSDDGRHFTDVRRLGMRYDLFVSDRASGRPLRVSVPYRDVRSNKSSNEGSLSADGRTIAFVSEASNLVPGDTNRLRDVFVVEFPDAIASIESVVLSEGDSGSPTAQLAVSLAGPSSDPVLVSYATRDGTAIAGEDYLSVEGTLTFLPGETTQIVSVPILADVDPEPNEAFAVVIGSPGASNVGQCTIRDDDGPSVRTLPTWNGFFGVDEYETTAVGDFSEDGLTDILTLTRDRPGEVGDAYVQLSTGSRFGESDVAPRWSDWLAVSPDEVVAVGDFNGDGLDDVATWLRTTTREVYVARTFDGPAAPSGFAFFPATRWLDSIGSDPAAILATGDANGDRLDDLILFARTEGKVYVALSRGSSFDPPTVWHGFFAVSTHERPRVADVDGDGRTDIVTFATDSPSAFGDVYVALSDGTRFVDADGVPNNSTKWHDWFAIRPTEKIRIGDLNGDGKDDFFTFLPPPWGQCYTSLSLGDGMGPNRLWHEVVAPEGADDVEVGDVNGDFKADVIVFARSEGKVYVSLAP